LVALSVPPHIRPTHTTLRAEGAELLWAATARLIFQAIENAAATTGVFLDLDIDVCGPTPALVDHAGSAERLEARRAGFIAKKGETHMENAIGFAAIAGAIFTSFAVALSLQWMSLVVLMKLMPARNTTQTLAQRVAAVPEIRRTSGLHRTAA
jgi:hypothetical protein